jgi:hypothetical protein
MGHAQVHYYYAVRFKTQGTSRLNILFLAICNHWRVNGLNSHRPKGDTDHIHSPYFGQEFLGMLDWINKNGGNCT